jgi:hypothetical protein
MLIAIPAAKPMTMVAVPLRGSPQAHPSRSLASWSSMPNDDPGLRGWVMCPIRVRSGVVYLSGPPANLKDTLNLDGKVERQ